MPWVPLVLREFKVLQEQQERLEPQVLLAFRERKAFKVLRVLLAFKALLVR